TAESELPVFVSVDNSGVKKYIFPVQGTGLWGPIWGYVALADDFNTITGVVFDHASETPGLGAEIAQTPFQSQFIGKTLFEGDEYIGVLILKGVGASKGDSHAVDAVSGGTITSRAVGDMLLDCLGGYRAYIESQRQA
ncbi:MAG: NADH:ubiquinone reductase (Na(+)-transporting) subunit C, partial [Rikenellaceae bacterium]